jgi:hypothetical protein
MSVADRRIRCGECKGWIQPGDEILFQDFRWHGRVDRLPIHPLCNPEVKAVQTLLETFVRVMLERSARDRVSTFTFQEAKMLPNDESDNWVI